MPKIKFSVRYLPSVCFNNTFFRRELVNVKNAQNLKLIKNDFVNDFKRPDLKYGSIIFKRWIIHSLIIGII